MKPYRHNHLSTPLKSSAKGKFKESTNDPESTDTKFKYLNAAIAEAEAQIADCRKDIESEHHLLESILAGERDGSITSKEYLQAGKEACRLGIAASELSIQAYGADIEVYRENIGTIEQTRPKGMSH